MHRIWKLSLVGGAFILAIGFALSACGGDEDCASVGGILCSNCANDCLSIELSCEAPKEKACVGLSYFDGQPSSQRCKFCLAPE